jgi:hypothetical protein
MVSEIHASLDAVERVSKKWRKYKTSERQPVNAVRAIQVVIVETRKTVSFSIFCMKNEQNGSVKGLSKVE